MKTFSISRMTAAAIAALGASALLLSMVLRDTATTEAATKQQTEPAGSVAETSVPGSDAVLYVSSAPYRDGLFEGKLARERGEAGRISAGRWSSQLDRSAYADGYLEGFGGPANSKTASGTK